MPASPQPMLSQYRLAGKLGQGGMGVVWRGEDTMLRRPVALKFLTATGSDDKNVRARFLREARTAASLNHPNICTIYQVGEVGPDEKIKLEGEQGPLLPGTPFIVMELVQGSTLPEQLS